MNVDSSFGRKGSEGVYECAFVCVFVVARSVLGESLRCVHC